MLREAFEHFPYHSPPNLPEDTCVRLGKKMSFRWGDRICGAQVLYTCFTLCVPIHWTQALETLLQTVYYLADPFSYYSPQSHQQSLLACQYALLMNEDLKIWQIDELLEIPIVGRNVSYHLVHCLSPYKLNLRPENIVWNIWDGRSYESICAWIKLREIDFSSRM